VHAGLGPVDGQGMEDAAQWRERRDGPVLFSPLGRAEREIVLDPNFK
jgi:hypothetical protein